MFQKYILSVADFKKRLHDYGRGRIREDDFIRDFVCRAFDFDSLETMAGLFDQNLTEKVIEFLQDSPCTEQQWSSLCAEGRKRAAERIRQPDFPADGHEDSWVFDYDPAWKSLQRFQVYALRTAFGLPVDEPDWEDSLDQHRLLIQQTNLPDWFFQSRTRWYALLCNFSSPRLFFRDSLSTETLDEIGFAETPHLISRLQLVEAMHPAYFFNFRKRVLLRLQAIWKMSF